MPRPRSATFPRLFLAASLALAVIAPRIDAQATSQPRDTISTAGEQLGAVRRESYARCHVGVLEALYLFAGLHVPQPGCLVGAGGGYILAEPLLAIGSGAIG